MNSVNTHLYFPADLYAQVALLARQTNVPVTKVVRNLVAEGLDKKASKNRGQRGPSVKLLDELLAMSVKAPKGTPADISFNHDKYLYDE